MGCLSQLLNFCISPFSQYSHVSVFMGLSPTVRFLLPQNKWSDFLRSINNKDSTQARSLGIAQELSVTCIHLLFLHWLLPVVLFYFLVEVLQLHWSCFSRNHSCWCLWILWHVTITLFTAFKLVTLFLWWLLLFWSALLQGRSKFCLI